MDQMLAATETLTVPDDGTPSTPPGFRGYPRYRWQIEVITMIAHQPDYHGRFTIIVTEKTHEPPQAVG